MRRRFGAVLILAGLAGLLWPYYTSAVGSYNQYMLEREWSRAQENAPPRIFRPFKLAIPAIHMKAVVVEGVSTFALRKGPGHFPETSLPGEPGNCCIAGHRNVYGAWFRDLDKVLLGDQIIINTKGVELTYRVTGRYVVLPDDFTVLQPTEDASLTLITCTPMPNPTHRLIVTANLAAFRIKTERLHSPPKSR